jgi:hypothetical protein
MSERMWCSIGLREWDAKPLEERKGTVPCRALQIINGMGVCNKADHVKQAQSEVTR